MIPGTGFLAAAVPGAFDGWMLLLRDFGTMAIDEVLAPAIAYAENGFPVLPRVTMSLLPLVEFFKAEWPSSAEVWLPGGQPPKPGTLFTERPASPPFTDAFSPKRKQPAATRERQIEAARDASIAVSSPRRSTILRPATSHMDGSGRRHAPVDRRRYGGLARHFGRSPASYDYGRYRVHKTGPWGQGPVLLQQLALLKGFDLSAVDPDSAEFVHVVTECAKLAFADREAFYGDPGFVDVPLRHY